MTLVDALKAVGFKSLLLFALIGTPVWLSFVNALFGLNLAPVFDWIVVVVDRLLSVFEAPFQGAVNWLNRSMSTSLQLNEIWSRLFAAQWVIIWAAAKEIRSAFTSKAAGIAALVTGVWTLIAALGVGLISLDGKWWVEGLMAAIPVIGTLLGVMTLAFAFDRTHIRKHVRDFSLLIPLMGGSAFILGLLFWGLLRIPGSGLVGVLGGTLIIAASILGVGMSSAKPSPRATLWLRVALRVLVPPLLAGIVLLINWLLWSYG